MKLRSILNEVKLVPPNRILLKVLSDYYYYFETFRGRKWVVSKNDIYDDKIIWDMDFEDTGDILFIDLKKNF